VLVMGGAVLPAGVVLPGMLLAGMLPGETLSGVPPGAWGGGGAVGPRSDARQ